MARYPRTKSCAKSFLHKGTFSKKYTRVLLAENTGRRFSKKELLALYEQKKKFEAM